MADCAPSQDVQARNAELEVQLSAERAQCCAVQARNAELEAQLNAERAQCRAVQARNAELEASLKNERAQFALAERAARAGYWRLTLPDFRKTWSPGMYALVGLEPGSPIPSVETLYRKDDEAGPRSYLDKRSAAIRDRSSYSERARILSADGSERIIDTLGEIEIGPDGDIAAVVGACHDVTQQVAAESERNEAQTLYRTITEAASDIIMVHDGRGNAQFASAALGHTLGWTIRNVNGQDMADLVHPDDLATAMEMRAKAASGGMTTATYRLRHIDGHYVWFETTMSLVRDEATGALNHIVTVLRDVSVRKEHELAIQAAREAAEAANRAKSNFLANMSHELRTPLNAILGFSDMIRQELFGPLENPRYRNYVALIHESGRHLLDLISDILDIAKIEAGKLDLKLKDLDLAEIVGECAQSMAALAASAGVEVSVSLSEQRLACMADHRAMRQVFLNLLSNAVKFTPRGGHVDVTAAIEGDLVRIVVRDDGIGIDVADLPRLAKPFEQVCNDATLSKSGTGLGLAIARALTEQHGGRLKIDSPEKKGTIVTVEFPRSAGERQVAA